MARTNPDRVLVAHEQTLSRLGIASLIAKDPTLSLVAQTATLAETVESAVRCGASVVVTGLRLNDGTALDLLVRLHDRKPPIGLVVLLSQARVHDLFALWEAGGHAILSEGVDTFGLWSTVHLVAKGSRTVDATMAETLIGLLARLPPDLQDIRVQETGILSLLASGLGQRGVARALQLKPAHLTDRFPRLGRDLGLKRPSETATGRIRHTLQHPNGSDLFRHEPERESNRPSTSGHRSRP